MVTGFLYAQMNITTLHPRTSDLAALAKTIVVSCKREYTVRYYCEIIVSFLSSFSRTFP